MAPKTLTEYERKRLENIKRNEEMLAALKIHSKLNDLISSSKPQRAKSESCKVIPKKKVRDESPIVMRRSLRSRGIKPDELTAGGLNDDYSEIPNKKAKTSVELGPIRMRDVCVGEELEDRKFVERMLDVSKSGEGLGGGMEIGGLDSMRLEEENVARVVQGRILSVRVFPCEDRRLVVVGNMKGNVGFWDVDCVDESDGIYVYRPHSSPVSGIVVQPFSMSKMFTCCFDGFIRLMDVEKEMFDLVYNGADSIYSIAQRSDDSNSLYFGEGRGKLNIWDVRTGKSSFSSPDLHELRISSIHFNACNTNMMATSSSDGTACIWDLRKLIADKPEALITVNHEKAVHSAYFSPSGSILATTGLDDSIKLLSGANYENVSKIHHNNRTGSWISSFRGIWGWDDSHVFIGNMERGVDVISTAEKRCIDTLVSPEMTANAYRTDVHPHKFGMLAGATSGGQSESCKVIPKKKVRDESPIVMRRSLRSRGIKPDELTAGGLNDDYSEIPNKKAKTSVELGPIRMRDVCVGEELEDRKFVERMLDVSKSGEGLGGGMEIGGLDSMRLEEENVARVVQGRILSVRVFPCEDRRLVVVGNMKGNVGFWDVDCVDESDGIYVYRPHSSPVSGIVVQPFSMSKMFTCCFDGFIRLMDVEKEMFDLVYNGADSIYSIAQRSDDSNSLYFGEGRGKLNIWDVRTGKSSFSSPDLHELRISSINFNACNTNMMATSSSDGTACIWVLRKLIADKPEALITVNHEKAVHSAYFSPSGSILATTGLDDSIKLLSGANYENVSKIHHNNRTGSWISSFRGIWGWDDSHVFIGNMERGVDVISTAEKRCIDTLVSPEMTANAYRTDVHPHKFGMLAGATSGGQVYLWTSSC